MGNHFSTAAQYNKFTNNISTIQQRLSKVPDKIEGKVDSFASFKNTAQTNNFVNTKAKLNITDNFITNNQIIEQKLNFMDESLENIVSIASNLKKNVTLKNSPAGKSLNISQIAIASLYNVQDSLNATYAGKYLFSGSKTDIQPVSDISKTNILNDVVTANYYKGDNFISKTQINKDSPLEYGIVASDPAFQNLIGAMNYIIEYEKDQKPETLAKANNLLDSSINSVIQLRSELGNNLNKVKNVNDQNQSLMIYLKQLETEILPADPLETIIQLSNDKVALEALFKTFSTLSSLNLTMYLK